MKKPGSLFYISRRVGATKNFEFTKFVPAKCLFFCSKKSLDQIFQPHPRVGRRRGAYLGKAAIIKRGRIPYFFSRRYSVALDSPRIWQAFF